MRLTVSILIVSALFAGACNRREIPSLYPVPNASLIDQSGRHLALDSMHGKVAVYDFIFTKCAGTCPLMTLSMKHLTGQFDASLPLHFISISVDPANDTPAVLQEFARRSGADSRWTFLTGERDAIVRLSQEGFKLAAGTPVANGAEPLLHSTKFVVADKRGVIRGYYDSTSPESVARMVEDVKQLAEEQ